MIAKFLSLNEMTKNHLVISDWEYENAFKVHNGDKIVKFPAKDDGLYLIKPDMNFMWKCLKRKINEIEGLTNFKLWGKKR